MKTDTEIGAEYVVFWIVLAILVVFLAWRTFGNSPTIESISFLLSSAGAVISWIGLKASFESQREHKAQTEEHKTQTEILSKIQSATEKLNSLRHNNSESQ